MLNVYVPTAFKGAQSFRFSKAGRRSKSGEPYGLSICPLFGFELSTTLLSTVASFSKETRAVWLDQSHIETLPLRCMAYRLNAVCLRSPARSLVTLACPVPEGLDG